MNNDGNFPIALTYDDVLLVPQRSSIQSRSHVSTSSRLTPAITLAVPVVSANMDSVTESRMAIAMARAGGLGIIHRFMSIDEQAAQVGKVKRSESYVIENPVTTIPDVTADELRDVFEDLGINGTPVVGEQGRLLGLVTRRDLVAAEGGATVADVMVGRDRLVTGGPTTTLAEARRMMADARVEKLPLVDADDRLVGLITMRDIQHLELFPSATKDARGRLRVGAAIGVRGDFVDRARACADAGADVLCLDIAHGHAEHAIEALRALQREVDVEIIAGNVATAEGARDLIEAGAASVKVGVGPGSVCTTRVVAGVGVPQLSAVLACAPVCAEAGIPMIADGGIRAPGDISKAIGAGADTVMLGNLLAGTTESPGELLDRNGRTLKVHRGMASRSAMGRRRQVDNFGADMMRDAESGEFGQVAPEGVEAVVPYRGDVGNVLEELIGGLRSAMSYSDAHTIAEMHARARFVRITTAGQVESRPHDVEI